MAPMPEKNPWAKRPGISYFFFIYAFFSFAKLAINFFVPTESKAIS